MTLGEFLAVRPVDQRHMRIVGLRPAHAGIDRQLPERVEEMIVAPDDVGDAHIVIVHHHGKHVSRRTVGAQQDQFVQIGIRPRDRALHVITHRQLARIRHAQAYDGWRAGRQRLGWIAPGGAEGL